MPAQGPGSKPVGAGAGGRRAFILAGVAAVSASVLVFEIALSRVFAVTQFYHFAFLAVSLALLGFGASGSVLSAFPRTGRGGASRWALYAAAQGLSTIGAYWVTNALPLDTFAIAWDRAQVVYLIVYYVALAVPFLFGGLVVGAVLTTAGKGGVPGSHRVYAASLGGSGLGCLVALWAVDTVGGERTVAVAAVLAAGGALGFTFGLSRRRLRGIAAALLAGALSAPVVFTVPPFLEMELSPYKGLSAALRYPGAEIVSTEWDRGVRVDLVASEGIRSLAGLSLTYHGPLPAQDGLTFNGDDLSPIPRALPDDAPFAPYLMSSLPFSLRPGGDVLVLEPRGGLDVLVALAEGAGRIAVVEPLSVVSKTVNEVNPGLYSNDRVEVVSDDTRSFLARTGAGYDVIDLALTAPYRPVTSGAYSLAEDYLLTLEAVDQYLSRLRPDGLLSLVRWAQLPPSEELRAVAIAAEAVRRRDGDPGEALVAIRGYATVLVMVKPSGFSEAEMSAVRSFAEDRRFDLVVGPGVADSETNRYNVLIEDEYRALASGLLDAADPDVFYSGYDFDIAPPADDRPFFGHFFKWAQAPEVLDTLGRTWQPFGGAGYFVLLALLVLAVAAAAMLILAPLAVSPRLRRGDQIADGLKRWTVAYFGLLGLAFLFVEIPLIQQYILLTGNATAALAIVLFVILVASGAGSLWSHRLSWRQSALWLAGLAAVYALALRRLIGLLMAWPLLVRYVAGAAVLAPIGLLMGVMFPSGLRRLEAEAPDLVPWAWGINGTTSVISGAASALLSLSYGFSTVMLGGAAAYSVAGLLARRRAPVSLPRG